MSQPQKLSASYKLHTAVLLHMEDSQINILYCLTLDFLKVSGNTVTLLEPPEDDLVSTFYSDHRSAIQCLIFVLLSLFQDPSSQEK